MKIIPFILIAIGLAVTDSGSLIVPTILVFTGLIYLLKESDAEYGDSDLTKGVKQWLKRK